MTYLLLGAMYSGASLIGGFYGSLTHNFIVVPYLEMVTNDQAAVVNPINLLLLCVLASVAVHLLLRRDRVRKGSSQPTSGWALGLAMGGMLSMVFILRILEMFEFNITLVITILCLALFGPRCEALISSFQGHLMLQGKRWGSVLRGTFWRCAYVVMFAFALVNVTAWLFIIPATLLFNRVSEAWIWESIPKEGKKRLRKIWARNAREEGSAEINPLSGVSSTEFATLDAGGKARYYRSRVRLYLLIRSISFRPKIGVISQISILGVYRTQPLYNAGATKSIWVLAPIAKASPTRVTQFATVAVGFWQISVRINSQWSNNSTKVVWIHPTKWPKNQAKVEWHNRIQVVQSIS